MRTITIFVGASQHIAEPTAYNTKPIAVILRLPNFFGERPDCKDADTHRYAADNGEHGLRLSVVICTEDIVREIDERDVLDSRADSIDKKIYKGYQHIFVAEYCL